MKVRSFKHRAVRPPPFRVRHLQRLNNLFAPMVREFECELQKVLFDRVLFGTGVVCVGPQGVVHVPLESIYLDGETPA